MASSAVYDELKTTLEAAFPASPVIDYDQIETALQQGTDAFFVLEETSGSEDQLAFGDETNICQREEGVIVVWCFTPAPEGSNAARTIADSVRDVLRPYDSATGLKVLRVEPPDIEMSNNGLWAAAISAINYQYNFYYSR